MQTVELIETLFDETRNVIHQRLDTLERQVNLVLAHSSPQTTNTNTTSCCSSSTSSTNEWMSHFNGLSQKLAGISNFLDQMNYRLKQLEEHTVGQSQKTQTHLRTPILGPQHLEGLVMVPEIKVSKKDESDLDTKNIVIQPNFTLPISDIESENTSDLQEFTELQNEKDMASEEQEIEEQEVVEDNEEEEQVVEDNEEEEQVVEDNEEEEEVVEDEPLELEEFVYKNKKYFKDQFNKVYRQIDEETPEDEPFAEYDEKTNRLTRLPN